MILVTGGSGLMGRALVRRLIGEGRRVAVLDRVPPPPELLAAGVVGHQGDVADPAVVGRAMEGVTAVVHLAALVADWGPAAAFERGNVEATRVVAEAARAHDVTRFVHMSSIAVLDYRVPRDDTDETAPIGGHEFPYGITKARAERFLQSMAVAGLPVVIVRPGLFVYGPGDARASAPMLSAVARGVPLMLDGGEAVLSTSYVENLVAGVARCLEVPAAVGEVFHLSDDTRVSWRTMVWAMQRALGGGRLRSASSRLAWSAAAICESAWALAHRTDPPPLTRYRVRTGISDLHVSNAKAKRVLGFAPAVGLDEGLAATVAWYRTVGG